MLFVLGLQAAHVLTDTGRLYYPLSLTQKAELHLDKDIYLFSVFDPEKKNIRIFFARMETQTSTHKSDLKLSSGIFLKSVSKEVTS